MSIAPVPTDSPRHMRRRIDALREAERRQTRRPGDPIPTPEPEPLTDWREVAVGATLALALVVFLLWVGTAVYLTTHHDAPAAPETAHLSWNPDARLDASQVVAR